MAKKSVLRLNTGELEQIKVLAASGLSYHAIGKKLGRDHKTIAKACRASEMAPQIEQVKVDLADRFENVAVRMLTAISDKDIMAINAYQRTLSAAISTDKMRLLKGHSTENLAIHQIVETLERDMAKRRSKELEKEQEEAVPENAVP